MNKQIRTLEEIARGSVLKSAPKTAREMALTAHSLSRSGDMATTDNGSVYVWDTKFLHWAIWK